MKAIYKFSFLFLVVSFFTNHALTQEQIGVASAVNKNTTDLTLEQERKLIDAGYEIIQNHTIEPIASAGHKCSCWMAQHFRLVLILALF